MSEIPVQPEAAEHRLDRAQVEKVARLARLRLDESTIETFRGQLATILGHIDLIAELDVEGVEPMAHPSELVDRLDDDEIGPALSREQVLHNAPVARDGFIVVPKVLGGGAEEGGGS